MLLPKAKAIVIDEDIHDEALVGLYQTETTENKILEYGSDFSPLLDTRLTIRRKHSVRTPAASAVTQCKAPPPSSLKLKRKNKGQRHPPRYTRSTSATKHALRDTALLGLQKRSH
jgi:hypothetical protein